VEIPACRRKISAAVRRARTVMTRVHATCRRLDVRRFAIDEAHCISHWGHDFRPDYRQMPWRKRFASASFHAFTATATPRVQGDIVTQLGLRDPAILIGASIGRILIYRIVPLVDRDARRSKSFDGIRKSGDRLLYQPPRNGSDGRDASRQRHSAPPRITRAFSPDDRHRTQEAFAEERSTSSWPRWRSAWASIGATCVACSMPRCRSRSSIISRNGRAGRDGWKRNAFCFYSAADRDALGILMENRPWMRRSRVLIAAQKRLIKQIQSCAIRRSAGTALSEYFGQSYRSDQLRACDFCLTSRGLEDARYGQKILSCVARTGERFGVKHVVDVLQGPTPIKSENPSTISSAPTAC